MDLVCWSEWVRLWEVMSFEERLVFEGLLVGRVVEEGVWGALFGPQRLALDSSADFLFYGGAAGGGKTDLVLGAALVRHQRSLIFRREYGQIRAMLDRMGEILGGVDGYNGQSRVWRYGGDGDGSLLRLVEFGACQHDGNEKRFQGRAHDLKAFDEITHFSEAQFRYLSGWLRSSDLSQRCRVICTGNPPSDGEGDWVIKFWAPWLDPHYPNPAEAGELRWFAMIDGVEEEVESGDVIIIDGEEIVPQSRTFIPSSVEDNPYLMAAGYKATLQALPEPLRSRMLKGDFGAEFEDSPWQIIPRLWVEKAQDRWRDDGGCEVAMNSVGVDVARGGRDRTVLVARHGLWFSEMKIVAGRLTPDGASVATLVAGMMEEGAVAYVDVIGAGASALDHLRGCGVAARGVNAASVGKGRDRSGKLGFLNFRAQLWWKLREALDPDYGMGLALPPSRDLLMDLIAPRWSLSARGIQVEAKSDVKKRLGRSPDLGDALTYAFADLCGRRVGLRGF